MKRLSFLLFSLFIYHLSAAQDATEIIRKMEDKMRGESSYSEVKMTIVRPRYTRDMSMKSWAKGDDFALILLTDPARDRGTAFLKRKKEIWNWVPSIDRMIKLPPSMMAQSWMGSDFTNDDLVRESSTIDDYTHKILRSEKLNEHECYVLELIPKHDAAIVWEKVLVWVDKKEFIQLKVENYDERGTLVSTIHFSDIKMMGGRLLPTRMEIIPEDKKGHKTVIEYGKLEFNIKMEDDFFSVQNLKIVR